MDHNNKAFVRDLLSWFKNKREKNYTDIIIVSSGQVAESISLPGTLIVPRYYIEYHARWDLELRVILTKHGY